MGSVRMNREQAKRMGPDFRGDMRLIETENSGDDHRRKGQEDTEKSCDQIFWFKGFVCPEETDCKLGNKDGVGIKYHCQRGS